ncbi:MAG: sulfatase-like hydrolase/transferase [Bacteroidia bacterium]|nr:sulfatase-like hydrolase/transferase [Bacteroidia bacterium]
MITFIPAHIKLLVKLYVFNLILFFCIRFLFYHFNKSSDVSEVPFFEKLMAFRMGLEFDTAVFCWIAYLPILLWSIAYLLKQQRLYSIGFYSFLVLILIYFFVDIADIPYFKQFGTHLNRNAFLWNENPTFAAGVIFGSFSYWGFFLVFFIITFIILKFYKKVFITFKTQLKQQVHPKWYYAILAFILLSVFVTLGARGRTSDRSGLHEGLSIVSQNNFINQIAINPNFTFWKTVLYNKNKIPYKVPDSIHEDIAFTRNYLGIQTPFEQNIHRIIQDSSHTKTKYNFVIVVMESMSVFKMGYYNGKNLTPHLDKLNKESIYCENFFSSGIHTFNGLFSTTTGHLSIYAEKSMKSYVKAPFYGLGPLMAEQGYETYFYTTHDPHFDNMEGFFKLNKFNHFVSQYDFDDSQAESSLGVPDHILLDKLIEITNNRKSNQPFLSVVMTASDHGPWRIPTNISYKPNGETPQENCTLYADWSIGRFMEQAKKLPWYNNTVFMFLGDHGLSMGHTYEMPLSYNHVPYIIHQPKLFKADTISSPCYQPDIPATVMGIIGANYTNKTFGINILKEQHPYVVFSADDKIGCVDNHGYYYYKTLSNGETYLRKYKKLDLTNYKIQLKAKADSMHENMMKIYKTAEYFIRKDHFLYE